MKRQTIQAGFGILSITMGSLALTTGCSDSKPVSAPPAKASSTSSGSSSSSSASSSSAPKTSTPSQGGTVAATGMQAYRGGLVAGQEQIDKTLSALAEMTDPAQTDLRGAYNKYCDALARMNEHSKTMQTEADAMRASRDQYFGKWEEKVTEIDNPTIRASAEARRKRLRDAHERIVTTSAEARDAYEPFMKDLQDIKKFLANDLSKGAIADIADAVKKVQADGATVKSKIGAVVETLDSVQGAA